MEEGRENDEEGGRENGEGEGGDSDEASIPDDCLLGNHVELAASKRHRGRREGSHPRKERETLTTIVANGSAPVDLKSVPTANCLTNSLKESAVRGVGAKRCIFPKGGSLPQTTTSAVEGERGCFNGEVVGKGESAPSLPQQRHNSRDGRGGEGSVRRVLNDRESVQASLESSGTCTLGTEERMDTLSVTMTMEQDSNLNSTRNSISESANGAGVEIDCRRLLSLFDSVVSATEGCGLEKMEKLLATFDHLVFRYRLRNDRRQLVNVSIVYVHVHCVHVFGYTSTCMYMCFFRVNQQSMFVCV